MKKSIGIFLTVLILGGIIMFGFSGCSSKKYNVDYNGQITMYTNAKESYREGKSVKLCFDEKYITTDTDYSFYLDDEEISAYHEENKGFIIEFVMPGHDVSLRIDSVNSMIRDGDDAGYRKNPVLTYDSFDGGGPDYTVIIDDESLLSYTSERRYSNPNHTELDGASYNVVFTFTGLKPGTTTMCIQARSPICDYYDDYYDVTVNDTLEVSIVKTKTAEQSDIDEPVE